MLPFRVIQIEQHRALQPNVVRPLPPQASSPLAKLSPRRNFATPALRILAPSSDRDFQRFSSRNMGCLTQKNETVLAKWAPTSNRKWPTNRCHRKQTTKPFLTEARTHIRLSLNF